MSLATRLGKLETRVHGQRAGTCKACGGKRVLSVALVKAGDAESEAPRCRFCGRPGLLVRLRAAHVEEHAGD